MRFKAIRTFPDGHVEESDFSTERIFPAVGMEIHDEHGTWRVTSVEAGDGDPRFTLELSDKS